MTERGGASAEPFFLAGSAGDLFAIHRGPAAPANGDAVLLVPPFAEEMNKARRMYALMARRLSAQGYGSLQVDLFGTGDSAGDFGDARWEVWLDDLERGIDYLARRNYRNIHLLALRLGALLAADLEQRLERDFRMVLWQPVTNGETFMTQFLRLRLAASMMSDQRETTDELRRMLRAGDSVEVAGYLLAPELVAAIESRTLAAAPLRHAAAIAWIDVVGAADRPLPPASARCVEALRKAGRHIDTATVQGESFWSTIEIAAPRALLDATGRVFEKHLDA